MTTLLPDLSLVGGGGGFVGGADVETGRVSVGVMTVTKVEVFISVVETTGGGSIVLGTGSSVVDSGGLIIVVGGITVVDTWAETADISSRRIADFIILAWDSVMWRDKSPKLGECP